MESGVRIASAFITIAAFWFILFGGYVAFGVASNKADAVEDEDCDCPESGRALSDMIVVAIAGGVPLMFGLYSVFAQHRKRAWVEANVSDDTRRRVAARDPG